MSRTKEALLKHISTFEDELQGIISEKQRKFGYVWCKGKVKFEKEILRQHVALRTGLLLYLLHSRILMVLTAPIIHAVTAMHERTACPERVWRCK